VFHRKNRPNRTACPKTRDVSRPRAYKAATSGRGVSLPETRLDKPTVAPNHSSVMQRLEPSGRLHVVEVAEMVLDADVIEHAAQSAQGNAHPVRAAEAAELAAALDVRF
jgi:hypothetical protein